MKYIKMFVFFFTISLTVYEYQENLHLCTVNASGDQKKCISMWAEAARDRSSNERLRPMLRSSLLCIWRKCGLWEHVEDIGFLSLENSVILTQELLLI